MPEKIVGFQSCRGSGGLPTASSGSPFYIKSNYLLSRPVCGPRREESAGAGHPVGTAGVRRFTRKGERHARAIACVRPRLDGFLTFIS